MKKYQLLNNELVDLYKRGRYNLNLFVTNFCSPQGKVFYALPHQEEFIQTMMTGNFDEGWMSGGNSSGKTWTAKWMAMHWGVYKFKPNKPWKSYKEYTNAQYNILCTGPEMKQAVELWEHVEQGFRDSPILKYRVDEVRTGSRLKTHPFIRLKNGTIIEAVGLHDKGRHVEGQSYDLVLINEPADVRSLIHCVEKVLTPRTWRRGGVIAGFGTPKAKGEYYIVFRSGVKPENGQINPFFKERVYSMFADSRDNPFADQERISQFLSTRNDSLILERIEGKFIDESSLAFPQNLVDEAVKDSLKLPIAPSTGRFYITGVDFGRKEDYTVAITLDISSGPPYPIVNYYRGGGGVVTWEEILGELLRIHNEYYGEFVIDATASIGDLQTEWLRDLGISFIPYQFAGSPAKKSNLITNLQRVFGTKQLTMPYIQQLYQELLTYPKNMDDKGMETDCVMSLALALHGAIEYGPIGRVEAYNR